MDPIVQVLLAELQQALQDKASVEAQNALLRAQLTGAGITPMGGGGPGEEH